MLYNEHKGWYSFVLSIMYGFLLTFGKNLHITISPNNAGKVDSLSSGKGKMFLSAACHAFTLHVNAWKN